MRLSPLVGSLKAPPRVPLVIQYDLVRHNFPGLVAGLLGVEHLSTLHLSEAVKAAPPQSDQDTPIHHRFYAALDNFLPRFQRLIAELIAPLFNEPFCFQRVPTFRVHLPDDVAVAEFHVDSDYYHQPGELNFWVPLTACWGTNSIWIEIRPGGADFHPVSLVPGQIMVFDANSLRHGNLVNVTGHTRVSFDFRCIPLSLYRDSGSRSVVHGVPLRVGEYFAIFRATPDGEGRGEEAEP